ncbi:MAG: hypothetical protein ACRENY_10265 [Candidatus Dormibacteria bacterium]
MARIRALLAPLIGEPAFRDCLRTNRVARSLPFPLLVGLAAVLLAAFGEGAVRLVLALVWAGCLLYALVAAGLLLKWTRRADRRASTNLSLELGHPVRVRGGRGRLEVTAWKTRIERSLERHRRADLKLGRRR